MNHYVVYHNPKRMGYPATDVDVLSIVTNKSVEGAEGSTVWLITGEGTPKRFSLRGKFTVDFAGPSDHDEFRNQVSGTAGKLFDPMIRIDSEEWFPEFKHRQGNFAFGFQPIGDPKVVEGLLRLVSPKS